MAVNIHITIIELNALHTKRQNLFQELDAVIHLLMEAKHWGLRKRDRKSGSAGMPRPSSYADFCLKKKNRAIDDLVEVPAPPADQKHGRKLAALLDDGRHDGRAEDVVALDHGLENCA